MISINLMQLSKRSTLVETAPPRLPSNWLSKSVNYNSVNLLFSLKTPDGSPTVLLPLKSLRIYVCCVALD